MKNAIKKFWDSEDGSLIPLEAMGTEMAGDEE